MIAVAIPIALLPSLAFGLDGELDDTRYPGDWWKARQVARGPRPGGHPRACRSGLTASTTGTTVAGALDPARYYFAGQRRRRGPARIGIGGGRPCAGAPTRGPPRSARPSTASPRDFVQTLADNGIDTVVIERNVDGPGRTRVDRRRADPPRRQTS